MSGSEFYKKKMTYLFKLWDFNKDNTLQIDDYRHWVDNLTKARGIAPDSEAAKQARSALEREFEALAKLVDKDKDGKITLDEWIDYYHNHVAVNKNIKDIIAASNGVFKVLDHDGSGFVSESEYVMSLECWGIPAEEGKKCFHIIDLNGDGKLTVDEANSLISDFYLSFDPKAAGNYFFGEIK
eukprot:TRINITY_DN9820_c0_g1_i1.p1 TRINITY_DN9820_c0_g1~~TRINITY_DN9820_c0_g1_i1.p1  ORF type:complete len:183 (-),score=38.20 TRINITY_DN9820_c0_g1_i1:25-573(-)